MENNRILEKLDGLEARFEEVSTLITDPNVIADQKRFVKLTKEYKDLGDIMDARKRYIACLNSISEAKDILALLRSEQVLAVKLITGSIGRGFYKCEYRDGVIYVNDAETSEEGFETFLAGLKNYIVMEFLRPHEELAAFWPDTANTLRYLICRIDGEDHMLKSFIRFGSSKTGAVENFNSGGVLCYIDDNGVFDGGYIIDSSKKKLSSVFVEKHPDTEKSLKGVIPHWAEICKAAIDIAKYLPETKYLGYDFVVTDKDEVKLLEINSLTSLDAIQLDKSILETEVGKRFFSSLKAY